MKLKIKDKIPKLKEQVDNFTKEVFKEELLDINQDNHEMLKKILEMEETCGTLT